MDAANYAMLASADDDVALTTFEGLAAAGQEAAARLGVPVTARDALTDEMVATFEPSLFCNLRAVAAGRSILAGQLPPNPLLAAQRGRLFLRAISASTFVRRSQGGAA